MILEYSVIIRPTHNLCPQNLIVPFTNLYPCPTSDTLIHLSNLIMRSATNKSELSQLHLTFYHNTFSPFKYCNTACKFTLKLKLGTVNISCIE